ncbi:MAG: hypothetical protein ABR567_02460 [Myxococcales bacterium]
MLFDLTKSRCPRYRFRTSLATPPDSTSATGLRVNASQIAPTARVERALSKVAACDWITPVPQEH